jgi:hypothetical protein
MFGRLKAAYEQLIAALHQQAEELRDFTAVLREKREELDETKPPAGKPGRGK